LQLEHRLALQVALEDERPAVGSARVQLVEGEPEPAEVLLPHRGDDVEPFCQLVGAVEDASERADAPPLPGSRTARRRCLAVACADAASLLPAAEDARL
jgi:hypothetical protein